MQSRKVAVKSVAPLGKLFLQITTMRLNHSEVSSALTATPHLDLPKTIHIFCGN